MTTYKDRDDNAMVSVSGLRDASGTVQLRGEEGNSLTIVNLASPDAIRFAHDVLAAAGAELGAPVGSSVGVDALAREIAMTAACANGIRPDRERAIMNILRRHWPAPTPVVVEVTLDDLLSLSLVECYDDDTEMLAQRRADSLNARLRARTRATPPTIHRKPAATASRLVVPESGKYLRRFDGEWQCCAMEMSDGEPLSPRISAIRRWFTHDGSTGPLIERQPATAGEWSVETTPRPDTPFWYWSPDYSRLGRGAVLAHSHDLMRLKWMADLGVTAWCYVTVPTLEGE